MTKIKLCGMTSMNDIEAVNQIRPDYVGFVFWPKSKRYISYGNALRLKNNLAKGIQTVGVFVDESLDQVEKLLLEDVIDMAQLHGNENEEYIRELKAVTNKKVIKAYRVEQAEDLYDVESCCADYVLLDSGAGSGDTFDWNLIKTIKRPFFLAGGLHPNNVESAVKKVHPFAVDVSSGIETNGIKDREKMEAFVSGVRKIDGEDI